MLRYLANIYRNAYSGLSPATWWLSAVMLVNRSGTMVVPFMSLYLTQSLHYPIQLGGLVMAIYGCGAVCGGLLGGKLTDKFGFFNVQLTALISGGVMFIVLGQMRSYPLICITAFILALLNDAFRPANTSAVAQYSSVQNRTRSFSLNRLAVNLGWAVGSAIGGLVAAYNYEGLFWIDGITNLVAALLLFIVLAPSRNEQTPSRKEAIQDKAPANVVFKDGIYLGFTILTTLFSFCFFQLFTTVPVFFKSVLLLEPNTIGAIMAMNGLIIALFEMVLVFRLERFNKNMQFIVVGVVLVGISYVVFNFPPGGLIIAIISTLIVTAGEMLAMPFMNSFMVSRTNQANRGQYAGLYTAAWSVAQVTAPYAGTLIVAHFGFTVLWWVIGGAAIATGLGFEWLRRQVTLSRKLD
ncbi:MAG: MFS transporter [Chitinophagia bacterium]|nr:MFS transporter [Chitinophagia bacterium]